MNKGNNGHLLDYLGYKNKLRTMAWEERLWRQHMEGDPPDVRDETERRRYGALLARVSELRETAMRLHRRRVGHQAQFATR